MLGIVGAPPHAIPPMLPGMMNDPRRLGGVKMPSERSLPISSSHHLRLASSIPQGASNECGARGSGREGERLRRGRDFARHVGLWVRAALPRRKRFAGVAIEHEIVADPWSRHQRPRWYARRDGHRKAAGAMPRRNPRDRDGRFGNTTTTSPVLAWRATSEFA